MITVRSTPSIVTVSLNDPAKRNALSSAMFDALERALMEIQGNQSTHILLLRGEGSVFCAGFDLNAALDDHALLPQFIQRLSELNLQLRRLPQVVVAAVHGAAIAGGCAILSACDFAFVAADAKLGYPVHRLGISPAVTIPTLQQAIGSGAARSLLMAGNLIDGQEAHRMGLATHLSSNVHSVHLDAMAFCQQLAMKGSQALRATKSWVNELDDAEADCSFSRTAHASAAIVGSDEALHLLANWQTNRQGE